MGVADKENNRPHVPEYGTSKSKHIVQSTDLCLEANLSVRNYEHDSYVEVGIYRSPNEPKSVIHQFITDLINGTIKNRE